MLLNKYVSQKILYLVLFHVKQLYSIWQNYYLLV